MWVINIFTCVLITNTSQGSFSSIEEKSDLFSDGSHLWKSNQMAVVDWNPFLLLNSQLSLSGEYLVVDGFGFGAQLRYQKILNEDWGQDSFFAGASIVQYLFGNTVNGWFAKGNASLFVKSYEYDEYRHSEADSFGFALFTDQNEKVRENVLGMAFGLESGYRFVFKERFSGALYLGLEREVPGFFNSRLNSVSQSYLEKNKNWKPILGASVGLVF